jgi:hypothetical protein
MELLRMIKKSNWILRTLPKLRINALGLATIKDIPTLEFISLIKTLKAKGWHIADEYYSGGVLDHYSKIKLKRNSSKLSLEWNNKDGGRIEGADEIIREITFNNRCDAVKDQYSAQENNCAA